MSRAAVAAPPTIADGDDLARWAGEQARRLRDGPLQDLDPPNRADEVQSLGASQKREIRRRLRVPTAHLPQWGYPRGRRGASWRATIVHRRIAIRDVNAASPSLRRYRAEVAASAFEAGRLPAAKEPGTDYTLFPEAPPFSIDVTPGDAFLPRDPDLEGPTP